MEYKDILCRTHFQNNIRYNLAKYTFRPLEIHRTESGHSINCIMVMADKQTNVLVCIYSGYTVGLTLFILSEGNTNLQDVKPIQSMHQDDGKTLVRSETHTQCMEQETEAQRVTLCQKTSRIKVQSVQSTQYFFYQAVLQGNESNTHTFRQYESNMELTMIEQIIQAFSNDILMLQREIEHQEALGHLLNKDAVQFTLGISSYD